MSETIVNDSVWISVKDVAPWRNEPMTEKQRTFISNLQRNGAPQFTGKTKGEAHDYIKQYKCEYEWTPITMNDEVMEEAYSGLLPDGSGDY